MGESLEEVPSHMERRIEIPVSITPTDAIRAMRVIGELRNWRMHRIEEATMVHRWAIIVPLAKRARVLGLVVDEGDAEGLTLRSWSYVPGSAGRMSFVSFNIPEWFDGPKWVSFLREWASLLPRCPWKWGFWERSIIGYLLPEFRRSRRQFSNEGIDIRNWQGSD
ncbi:MAG: hypothetical protein QF760_01185 [Candidatus Thalassarchaeaceae archaeon]|jgi:hypothetical protein|nr:hypothetical protein [Candidatus Thalassarchaeaceae archaeon]MDP6703127.1 hypothetical protein [Candidatus Thalassarchaeaceae archaeon]MDP7003772.1 hypothetical protein [Candidatus Thalassarchaeaceae archaeon]